VICLRVWDGVVVDGIQRWMENDASMGRATRKIATSDVNRGGGNRVVRSSGLIMAVHGR